MNDKKRQIVEVAARLFEQKGYHATTIQDIADQFGFTKAALYYYIRSKEEVLCEIFNQTMTTAERRLEQTLARNLALAERIRAIIHSHVYAVLVERSLLAVFFNEAANLPPDVAHQIRERRRRYERTLFEVFEEGVRSGLLKDLDVQVVVFALLGMCNWLHRWYRPDGRLPVEAITDIFTEIVLHGVWQGEGRSGPEETDAGPGR